MLQAWVATQYVGANDVIAIAPNREESTLTDYELRYAIYQRLERRRGGGLRSEAALGIGAPAETPDTIHNEPAWPAAASADY